MKNNNQVVKLNEKALGAMLGSAYGDALGWPNEIVRKTKDRDSKNDSPEKVKTWTRRSGGRYTPYEEQIKAGEYSDDTQLILCVSRSLMCGGNWLKYFTQTELPFWKVYERGGGGATKRAVNSWLKDTPPWSPKNKKIDREKYFSAGGNGVAMRILPHIIVNHNERSFDSIAIDIIRDGICTHGHPKALVGAVVFGYALWLMFNKNSKLEYGELVNNLINDYGIWSEFPEQKIEQEWMIASNVIFESYVKSWESVSQEVVDKMEICAEEINKGGLANDDKILRTLDCFDPKTSGAGTVASVAAIYLASRFSVDPINGVMKAAFAFGIDTDTIASMTGALLGAINGTSWLSALISEIQDKEYLETMTRKLVNRSIYPECQIEKINENKLKKWTEDAFSKSSSDKVILLDGRTSTMIRIDDKIGKSGKYKVQMRKFVTSDGQSIYVNKISKRNFDSQKAESNIVAKPKADSSVKIGTKLAVQNFEKSIWFYRDLLGLTIKKQSKEHVVFSQGLVLVPIDYIKEFNLERSKSIIYFEISNISEVYQMLISQNINIVTQLSEWGISKRKYFRCNDLDGNSVEIFSIG